MYDMLVVDRGCPYGILIVILSGTLNPWYSMSLIIPTTVLRAGPSMGCPSSAIIFQPFLAPRVRLILKETSWVAAGDAVRPSGEVFLELTAELFRESDFSRAALKLAHRLISLLKLLARFKAGLMGLGERRGESWGRGEWGGRGGEREGLRGLRSKGDGDLE